MVSDGVGIEFLAVEEVIYSYFKGEKGEFFLKGKGDLRGIEVEFIKVASVEAKAWAQVGSRGYFKLRGGRQPKVIIGFIRDNKAVMGFSFNVLVQHLGID